MLYDKEHVLPKELQTFQGYLFLAYLKLQLALLFHFYLDEWIHFIMKRLNQKTQNRGHEAADGIMFNRIVECLQKGLPLDQSM